jgi:glycine/D-amino acid oxidase-like deaminating enzyme
VPIIGKSADMAGLVLATGHTHMGLAMAPITGRLVREIVRDQEPSYRLAALSPDRFQALL